VATVVEPEIENVQRAVMFVVMNADNSQKKKTPSDDAHRWVEKGRWENKRSRPRGGMKGAPRLRIVEGVRLNDGARQRSAGHPTTMPVVGALVRWYRQT
jgi:hypothetical protein